jgi:hypothetical protein
VLQTIGAWCNQCKPWQHKTPRLDCRPMLVWRLQRTQVVTSKS